MAQDVYPSLQDERIIRVERAGENNLQDIDVTIPRNKLVVITGVSGSGKSSLAFDTLHAEGQRRYLETFSAYARQFMGGLERPKVERITGLSPVIAIEQKTISRNPRSTVGTVTELLDFLRVLYARAATAYSSATGEPMVRFTDEGILARIAQDHAGERLLLLAPLVRGRKGHYRELFESIQKQGYLRARVDGEVVELEPGYRVDRYKVHDIEVVVDRIVMPEVPALDDEGKPADEETERVMRSVRTALAMGKGSMMVLPVDDAIPRHFSRALMCPTTGISYPEPEPNLFSFNSPYGACPSCNGLGQVAEADRSLIIPDETKNLRQGGLAPLGALKAGWTRDVVLALLVDGGHSARTPMGDVDEATLSKILYGDDKPVVLPGKAGTKERKVRFDGVIATIERAAKDGSGAPLRRWAQRFLHKRPCPACGGSRLKPTAHQFRIADATLPDVVAMDLASLARWAQEAADGMDARQAAIATEPLKEIAGRLGFLLDMGLEYLTLDRPARSLSGGEAQRIRLATQIGSKLTGVLYILDEPSIGLHQRDNQRLIDSLKTLRDVGNTVIVVEHDEDMMRQADHLIDIGPGAGKHGGQVVAEGPPSAHMAQGSVTADFIDGRRHIAIPAKRRKGNRKKLALLGATGHNLKSVDLKLPLGTLTCVTGVSGSGKSSLINQTLHPALHNHYFEETKRPLPFKKINGLQHLDKVIAIDQSPIGRTPRSNPATYTGVFNEIRNLFTQLPEAKIRGYKPGRFSFNVAGGRCDTCKGAGLRTIEMNFLPDVHVPCEDCGGKRYNRETVEVRYRGKSIADILGMTVEEALEFFEAYPKIKRVCGTLRDVGLGYITLGQPSTTLSGGEAQRVKLATELARKDTGNTFYILDEPTTGLHFQDVEMLLNVLHRLVDQGNSVLVIEHQLDVICNADYVIDIGPEGGHGGGQIVSEGTPEEVAANGQGATAPHIAATLKARTSV